MAKNLMLINRTMHINGDEILEAYHELKTELARNHKLKEDPRITRVGHFLRKWSLDELPQLFNVLKQDMSLVGPRMITPAEMKMYDEWSMNLLTVRPGITGLWQVSGRSDISTKSGYVWICTTFATGQFGSICN